MAIPVLGREMILIYDSSVVGFGQNYSFGGEKEMIEVTTLSSNGNKEYRPGDKGYTFDFDGLVSRTVGDSSRGFTYIMSNFINSDASLVVAAKLDVSGNTYYEFVGFAKSIKLQGGIGNKPVTFSGSVQPTGVVNIKTA